MKVYYFPEGDPVPQYMMLATDLMDAPVVHTGEWQTLDTGKSKAHATHEMEDVSLVWDRIPPDIDNIFPAIDHDWADDHFLERVRGLPYNPPPSHLKWPYAVRGNGDHIESDRFDHTYPERFWPQHAGHDHSDADLWSDSAYRIDPDLCGGRRGIRFNYGDLDDVVELLIRSPLTRQAYLPVWFPEDTGATEGQRVPCTLGYHFMQRRGRLSIRYYLRSCDIYRHLSNDVWLAAMLMSWVANQVTRRTCYTEAPVHFRNGGMAIHISSLHAFVGDEGKMRQRLASVSA